MKRTELLFNVAIVADTDTETAGRVLDALALVVGETLSISEGRVELPGLGSFKPRTHHPRLARLPNGREVAVPGSKGVAFVLAARFKKRLNQPEEL